MRVVLRVYKDGNTKPFIDEYKSDATDFYDVDESTEDIRQFLRTSLEEILDDDDDSDGNWVVS